MLTLQNWVSRIPGGIFGKLGGYSKIQPTCCGANPKFRIFFIVCRRTQKYEIVGRRLGTDIGDVKFGGEVPCGD